MFSIYLFQLIIYKVDETVYNKRQGMILYWAHLNNIDTEMNSNVYKKNSTCVFYSRIPILNKTYH